MKSLNIKYYNKLPYRLVSKMLDLSWSNYESCQQNETFVAFFDENDDLIGLSKLEFKVFAIKDGNPLIEMYIWKFEVNPKKRGNHFGKAMYNWLINTYKIDKIGLQHIEPAYDNGSSKSWWKSLGFKYNKGSKSCMFKLF